MPLGEKVIPNVIGVDIGCGLEAACLGPSLPITGEELDDAIRARIPMGYGQGSLSAPDREYYHIKDDFPWETVNETLHQFIDLVDADEDSPLQQFADRGGYDINYFKELVNDRASRMGRFGMSDAINSMGTLGSGNHFIEIGQSDRTGDYWIVIHSGSRGLGSNTAEYWQAEAIKLRDDRADRVRNRLADYPGEYLKFDRDSVGDNDLLDWVQGGKGEDFINYDAIPKEQREAVRKELNQAIPDESLPPIDDSLDYLEGEEAHGYFIDMIFCQRYAVENRKMMAQQVADILATDIQDSVTSVHNFIDFRDGIIRKGATRAYDGERAVIPLTMKDGTLLVKGKSNPDWNYSSPHGAGRAMRPGEAEDTLDRDTVEEMMSDIVTTNIPLGEAPQAYKAAAQIEDAIEPTATIIDRIEPVHNVKA